MSVYLTDEIKGHVSKMNVKDEWFEKEREKGHHVVIKVNDGTRVGKLWKSLTTQGVGLGY